MAYDQRHLVADAAPLGVRGFALIISRFRRLNRAMVASVAVERTPGTGARAFGDGGLGRADRRHTVGRVGAADARRSVALHRHALHGAARRIVVVDGIVLDGAVV